MVNYHCRLCQDAILTLCVLYTSDTLCAEDLAAIDAWQIRMNESDHLKLCETGWQEFTDIGNIHNTIYIYIHIYNLAIDDNTYYYTSKGY